MDNFGDYSAIYDLLYRQKDYAAEAAYVARTIRSVRPDATRILELGSGTGRHGRLLAGLGFRVHGIERSPGMVEVAQATSRDEGGLGAGSFTCEVGDLRTIALRSKFDAVVALFHVISYQTTDESLRTAFRVAYDHLAPAGVFLFDVWHGPAVLAERPECRTREIEDERYRVTRIARPNLDMDRQIVTVMYDFKCEDRRSGELSRFSEEHPMRYLFPAEVAALAEDCGFRCILEEEFASGAPSSERTWGVAYMLQKAARS